MWGTGEENQTKTQIIPSMIKFFRILSTKKFGRGKISQETLPLQKCLWENGQLFKSFVVFKKIIVSFKRFILLKERTVLISVGVIWTLQYCPLESAVVLVVRLDMVSKVSLQNPSCMFCILPFLIPP